MGWTGCNIPCPQTKGERVWETLRQEGFHREDIVDMAMVGTTLYMAVRYESGIFGVVILTDYDRYNGMFYTKVVSEDMGPCECDCPKHVLDKLSPTDHEYAIEWRKRCEAKRKAKTERRKNDGLAKLPYGTKIRLLGSNGGRDFNGRILTVAARSGRRTFVDYDNHARFTKPLVEAVGWEIVR